MLRYSIMVSVIFLAVGCNSSESTVQTTNSKPQSYKSISITNNITPITVFAELSVGDEYLVHAANIAAKYLDSDGDGIWDNQAVANHMANLSSYGATLFIFKQEYADKDQFKAAVNKFPSNVQALFVNDKVSQSLYETEMVLCPSSTTFAACFPAGSDKRDASYEEILHIITHTGYAQVYSELSESETVHASAVDLADIDRYINVAMDNARGDLTATPAGTTARINNLANSRDFTTVNACDEDQDPDTGSIEYDCVWSEENRVNGEFVYPAGSATFSYYDSSADYSTMVTEYTYWTINAALGMLEHLSGNVTYSNEYRCLSLASFAPGAACASDTGVQALYGAGAVAGNLVMSINPYQLPTSIPFGAYTPNGTPRTWSINK